MPIETFAYISADDEIIHVDGTDVADKGFWSGSIAYQPNDVVQYQNALFIAISANHNQFPTSIRDSNWATLVRLTDRVAPITLEETYQIAMAGSGTPYLYGSANVYAFTKFQTTLLQSVAGSTAAYVAQTYPQPYLPLVLGASKPRRSPIFVDITRNDGGAGLATVSVYGCSSTTVAYDYRPDHLWAGIDYLGVPPINSQTMTTLASSAVLTIGDAFSVLDTFSIFWSRSYAGMLDIYAMGASVSYMKPTAYITTGLAWSGAGESFDGVPITGNPVTAAQAAAGTFAGGWASNGTLVSVLPVQGTVMPGAYYGTQAMWPIETFESYSGGTIYQDFSLTNTGQYWSGAGTVLAL